MSTQAYKIGVFSGQALSAGGSAESSPLLLNSIRPGSSFTTQLEVEGQGMVDVDLLVSVNEESYLPLRQLYTSAMQGEYIQEHELVPGMRMKFRITESTLAEPATVSLWICLK
jgi:hypothetical protein